VSDSKGEAVTRLVTIAVACVLFVACGAPNEPTASPAPTVLAVPTTAAATPLDPTPVLTPGQTLTPTVTCAGVGDETCKEMVTLVRRAYPAQVAAASAIIVADTCPPTGVCDRLYPFDAAVVVVPAAKADAVLALHVFGRDKPERVESWQGALPAHVAALVPNR
jgi:hypothetical protein